jgi:hypothetical protein
MVETLIRLINNQTNKMKTKLNNFSLSINVYKRLIPVASQLHRIAERKCNGYADTDWGRKQEQRDIRKEANLLNKAISLADEVGLYAYHQTDPRGVSLYLIDNSMNDTNYNNGVAIY